MKKKPRILVVDDDSAIRNSLTARLSHAGFDVVSAPGAQEGWEAFKRWRPDGVVLDVKMPESDGFAVCERIRSTGSHVPILFLTGADEGVIRNHLETLTRTVGGNHFLTKPFDGKALAMMLHDAVTRPLAATTD